MTIKIDDQQQVETPTPGETTQVSGEVAAVPTETPETEPEGPKYTEKELREQLNRVAAATRREVEAKERQKRQAAEAERDAFKRKAEAGARPMPPDPSSFTKDDGTIEGAKYNRAMVEYEDKLHGWRQAQASTVAAASPAETTESPEMAAAAFLERAAPLKQKHADFEQVINSPVFTPEMRDAIFDSEQGPEVAYFLGKNPAEANRIAGMQPAQMLREIGRLEARFSAPNQRAISSAPSPITPVTGTAGAPKDPEKMSTAEFMAWEKQQRLEKLKQNPLGV